MTFHSSPPFDRRARRVAAPRAPEPRPAPRFPVFAAFAPVLASLAVWAITRSVLALAFAALGPVIAIATTADSRLQQRRARTNDIVAFAAGIERARAALRDAHAEERRQLERVNPTAAELASDLATQPLRWRTPPDDGVGVRIGTGEVASRVEYADDQPEGAAPGGEAGRRLADLEQFARSVVDAPVVFDSRLGVGLIGPPHFALAVARGIELQLAVRLSPAGVAASLAQTGSQRVMTYTSGSGSARATVATVATAARISDLPRELGVVVEIDGEGRGVIIRAPGECAPGPIRLEFVSLEAAGCAHAALAECAELEGVHAQGEPGLGELVESSELPCDHSPNTLRTAIGVGHAGPVWVDLVADGPHAIVAGTTGAGKSELLLSWVIGMIRDRAPDLVTFLFVDFKGGAAFDPLRRLRHCVGVITDLDPGESLRALLSLGAELRHRERELARLGRRSIADFEPGAPAPFPRLVVMVDEYAALVGTHSVLHAVFTDIAARGRSLGVHLVLCTQSPAGVVRDGILANCSLRISLRVASHADSAAVIGTGAAAALPARPIGRALVSLAAAPPDPLQVARSSASDIDEVVDRWSGAPEPRKPWLPPLPRDIPMGEPDHGVEGLAFGEHDGTIAFALVDRPEEQRREFGRYDPDRHGSLLVVGAAGSGKTGVLDSIAAAPSTRVCQRVEHGLPALWDALSEIAPQRSAVSAGREPGVRLLLIDDLDAVVASSSDDYQVALIEALARVLREGPARGVHCVLTAQRIPGMLASLAAQCGSRVLLRTVDRQEHLLAGGAAEEFVPDLPPGAGYWRGHRIQVLRASPASVDHRSRSVRDGLSCVELRGDLHSFAVVSTNPARFVEELRAREPGVRAGVLGARAMLDDSLEATRGYSRQIQVSDPDGWQAHWSLLGELRRAGGIVFDGCAPSEIRALTRVRDLPPPFERGERPVWLLDPSGELHRARLPHPRGVPGGVASGEHRFEG